MSHLLHKGKVVILFLSHFKGLSLEILLQTVGDHPLIYGRAILQWPLQDPTVQSLRWFDRPVVDHGHRLPAVPEHAVVPLGRPAHSTSLTRSSLIIVLIHQCLIPSPGQIAGVHVVQQGWDVLLKVRHIHQHHLGPVVNFFPLKKIWQSWCAQMWPETILQQLYVSQCMSMPKCRNVKPSSDASVSGPLSRINLPTVSQRKVGRGDGRHEFIPGGLVAGWKSNLAACHPWGKKHSKAKHIFSESYFTSRFMLIFRHHKTSMSVYKTYCWSCRLSFCSFRICGISMRRKAPATHSGSTSSIWASATFFLKPWGNNSGNKKKGFSYFRIDPTFPFLQRASHKIDSILISWP